MGSEGPTVMQAEAGRALAFARAFDAWAASGTPDEFPYRETLSAYLAHGKHFVPRQVTNRLSALRARGVAGEGRKRLDDFLAVALDKIEGRYDYGSYCALNLLGLPGPAEKGLSLAEIHERRDMSLLGMLGDVVSFELDALEGRAACLPEMRPEPALGRRRLGLAMSALRRSLERLGWRPMPEDTVETRACAFLAWRRSVLPSEDRQWLTLTMLPVYVVHDEYLFLRVLQSFEVNFAWTAVLLRGAIAETGTDPAMAVARLQMANATLREASRFFPVLASMQVEAFQKFRRYTEGASAIQSAGYKIVEALCRRPDPDRLSSVAFASVPEVREAVESGMATLEEAYETAGEAPDFREHWQEPIRSEMARFADQLLRWRRAHVEIARRFLGEKTGTGYTEGVPYLDRVRDLPVFAGMEDVPPRTARRRDAARDDQRKG